MFPDQREGLTIAKAGNSQRPGKIPHYPLKSPQKKEPISKKIGSFFC